MWVLIVVTAFYQRGPQPEVQFHDFVTQEACQNAANWTSQALQATLRDGPGLNNVQYRVACERKN